MSFEDEKKQQEARKEAEEEIGMLTEDELDQIAGAGPYGDARRDVNEAMADAHALEQDIDGFDA